MSSDGFGASAIIRDDGRYFLQSQYGNGIPGGTYKVVIQPPSVYEGPVGDTPVGGDLESDIKILPFPVKYQEFSTSDLQFIAQPGSKEFDVTLEN